LLLPELFYAQAWWLRALWLFLPLLLAPWFSTLPWVQRLFLPYKDRLKQVEDRAEIEFYRQGLQKTGSSTGVLVMVSLLERQAVILGDKGIAQKIPPESWQKFLQPLILSAQKDELSQGLLKVLEDIRPLLQQHFPAREENPNELANHLIFVEA
jgi:putative membrane protein